MKLALIAKIFLILIATPTALIGLQAFFDPQAVMDNVDVMLILLYMNPLLEKKGVKK